MKLHHGFYIVGVVLGLTLFASGYYAAKGKHYVREIFTPAYCHTDKEFEACVMEELKSQGAPPDTKLKCQVLKDRSYICDMQTGTLFEAVCYQASAKRAKTGFPLLGTVNQEATC
jgi:hypothetical protein